MVSSIGAPRAQLGAAAARPAGSSELGKDDFLKLLIAKLRQQDPLRPGEDQEFIAQLAQFNALAEMQELNQQFTAFRSTSELAQASAFLGREVTGLDARGRTVRGLVSEVRPSDDGIQMKVGNTWLGLDRISQVRAAAPQQD